MFGLDQSPRYACRSTSPPPPAPLPRSGFVQRPKSCHFIRPKPCVGNWAVSGQSAFSLSTTRNGRSANDPIVDIILSRSET